MAGWGGASSRLAMLKAAQAKHKGSSGTFTPGHSTGKVIPNMTRGVSNVARTVNGRPDSATTMPGSRRSPVANLARKHAAQGHPSTKFNWGNKSPSRVGEVQDSLKSAAARRLQQRQLKDTKKRFTAK